MTIDTKLALLSALIEGESYGLELIERVKTMTGGLVKLQQGRVYPLLRELEAEGLAESYVSEPAPGKNGRPRQYYLITAKGKRWAREGATGLRGLLAPAWGLR